MFLRRDLPPVAERKQGNETRQIGGVAVTNPLWFAPLAAISMAPVRDFYRELGAGLTHTEMISCAGLLHGNRVTRKMLPREGESPLVLQIFGDSPEEIARGAEEALRYGALPEAVEVNMACPVRKVMRRKEGAALLNYPKIAGAMIKSLQPLGIPVWGKIRLCGPGQPLETEEFCEVLLEAGAMHISVHGRTPAQKYAGSSNRDEVGAIAVRFPGYISGSGDVYTPEDVRDYLRRGCVGVLLARGVICNPFLFPQALKILGYPVEETLANPSLRFRVQALLHLAERMVAEEGEKAAVVLLKRFLGGIFRGLSGAVELRRTIGSIKDWPSLEKVVREWELFISERGEHYGGTAGAYGTESSAGGRNSSGEKR
jgi:tRNA-dihydrouridine synthase B